MNIIVVSQRLSGPRTFNLADRRVWLPLGAIAGGALLVVLGLGTALGAWLGRMPLVHQVQAMENTQAAQEAELAALREGTGAHMNGLALRLGELQAQTMRLNALGKRLVQMANLQDGEFNFDQVPALGGPDTGADAPALEIPGFDDALDAVGQRLADQRQQLSVLEQLLLNRKLKDRQEPAGRPVKSGWLSSTYGTRIDPFNGTRAFHSGMDFAGREGTDVLAVADGVVTWAGDRYGYGKMVEIDHGNGYSTRYAHNEDLTVHVGDRVHKGQVISHMGDTGRATAPNLHFEVLKDGKTVNPYKFVKKMD